jgi:hypothetical protein
MLSPTPWSYSYRPAHSFGNDDAWIIHDKAGRCIAEVENEDDAKEIVSCVNDCRRDTHDLMYGP